jgi:integrase
MPSFRKLPSGLWQAAVYLPNGSRTTRSDKLKKVVERWAYALEEDIERGQWRDPRDGRMTVGEWAKLWRASRIVEPETARGDAAQFRYRILPRWEKDPLNSIRRMDVQAWVKSMEADPNVGDAATVRSYNLFSKMLGDAVIEGRINETPCVKIRLPRRVPKMPSWFTRDQVDRIQAELQQGPAAMVELMVFTALRWGEAAGCVGQAREDGKGNPIDWVRGKVQIRGTMDQYGHWKEYPKTAKSRREIPVPPHVRVLLSPLLADREPYDWLFVASRRSPGQTTKPAISGANWRRVWYSAIKAANVKIERENRALPKGQRIPPIPDYDPHDCRHTAASWLVQEGVPLYDVQALLGHESFATTQRYAHLQPDAHGAIEDAWEKIITHQARIAALGNEKKGD